LKDKKWRLQRAKPAPVWSVLETPDYLEKYTFQNLYGGETTIAPTLPEIPNCLQDFPTPPPVPLPQFNLKNRQLIPYEEKKNVKTWMANQWELIKSSGLPLQRARMREEIYKREEIPRLDLIVPHLEMKSWLDLDTSVKWELKEKETLQFEQPMCIINQEQSIKLMKLKILEG
jgi:hypothetical protein